MKVVAIVLLALVVSLLITLLVAKAMARMGQDVPDRERRDR